MSLVFIGQKRVLYKNYEYEYNSKTKNETKWVCNQGDSCKAFLTSKNDRVIAEPTHHNHEEIMSEVETQIIKAVIHLKQRVLDELDLSIDDMIQEQLNLLLEKNFSEHEIMEFWPTDLKNMLVSIRSKKEANQKPKALPTRQSKRKLTDAENEKNDLDCSITSITSDSPSTPKTPPIPPRLSMPTTIRTANKRRVVNSIFPTPPEVEVFSPAKQINTTPISFHESKQHDNQNDPSLINSLNKTEFRMLKTIKMLETQFKNVKINFLNKNTTANYNFNYIYENKCIFIISCDNKWFTLTNMNNRRNKALILYDSLNDLNHLRILNEIFKKFSSEKKEIKIESVNVEKQFGYEDNDLFALAYAMSLLNNKQPELIKYTQISMRHQFEEFTKKNYFEEFEGIIFNPKVYYMKHIIEFD